VRAKRTKLHESVNRPSLHAQAEEASGLLKQYPDTHMVATPVSKRVNTPKN